MVKKVQQPKKAPKVLSLVPGDKVIRKATTRRGRRILEERAPKLLENPKQSVFLKGVKSSQKVNDLMKDFHLLRGSKSVYKNKKLDDIRPFESPA